MAKESALNNFKNRLNKLNLECLDVIDENFKFNIRYKLKDREGYMYNISSKRLSAIIENNSTLGKFFNGNPYTFENINNYFKLNKIDLELITTNPNKAGDKILFKCLKHNIIFKRTWNDVICGGTNCPSCIKDKKSSNSLVFFKNKLKTLNIDVLEEIDKDFKRDKRYKVKDKDGYMYSVSSKSLEGTKSRVLSKFFNGNPYTFENINNYFKLNNIDLELITKGIKNSKQKAEFKSLKYNTVFKRSWNEILSQNINPPEDFFKK